MKKTRKLLALMIVMVMVFSMIQFVSAADIDDFDDADKVENTEQFGLLVALGVFEGDEYNNLNPDKGITREEAVAVIVRIAIGPTLANVYRQQRVDTGFTDVTRARWSSGLVRYAVEQGYVVGIGNNKFGPTDLVTIPQFAIMLMRVLGLAGPGDFTGASYAANAIVAAMGHGILTGEADFTDIATRDQVALFTFNALFVGAKTTTVTKYQIVTSVATHILNETWYDSITDALITGNAAGLELGTNYEIKSDPRPVSYGGQLEDIFDVTKESTYDVFGRPQTQYKKAGVAAPLYTIDVDPIIPSYTTAVANGAIYSALKLTSVKNGQKHFVDGEEKSGGLDITSSTGATGGRGTLTQVYKIGNDYRITVINEYFGEVVAIDNTDGIITIDSGDLKGELDFKATGFEVGDPVIVTATYDKDEDEYTIRSAVLAESLTLKLTAYTGTSTFVAGGSTYRYSANALDNIYNAVVTDKTIALGDEIDIYFDTNGNVIYFEKFSSGEPPKYAMVLDVGSSTDAFLKPTYYARLLYTDGTVDVVEVDKDYKTPVAPDVNYKDYIVSYTENFLGQTVLTKVGEKPVVKADLISLEIQRGRSTINIDSATVYADATTIFIVPGPFGTWSVYTGISNVPTYKIVATALAGADYTMLLRSTGRVSVFWLRDGTAAPETSTTTIFLANNTGTAPVVTVESTPAGPVSYREYNAVLNGEITKIKVDSTSVSPTSSTLYDTISWAGEIASIENVIGEPPGVGTGRLTDGTIGLGGLWFTYTTNCAVFYVNSDGGITSSSVGAIATDLNDDVIYTLNSSGQVTSIYITVRANTTYSIENVNPTPSDSGGVYTVTVPSSAVVGSLVTVTIKLTDDSGFASGEVDTLELFVNGTYEAEVEFDADDNAEDDVMTLTFYMPAPLTAGDPVTVEVTCSTTT